jgi:hypothetical protein
VKDLCGKMVPSEPTPLQLTAWQRLWSLLLAPNEAPQSSSAASAGTGAALDE